MALIILILLVFVAVFVYDTITAAETTAKIRESQKEAVDKKCIDSVFNDVEKEINLYQLSFSVYRSLGPDSIVERDAQELWSDMLEASGLPRNSAPPIPLDEDNLRRIEATLEACVSLNEGDDKDLNEALDDKRSLLLQRIRRTSLEFGKHRRQVLVGLEKLKAARVDDRKLTSSCSTWQGDGVGMTGCPASLLRSGKRASLIQFLHDNGIDRLYHFTDLSNFESIVKNGGLYSWSYCEANEIVISRPGGSALSRELDTRRGLEDYVRMSFLKDHPMLHAARRDGRLVNPVALEIDLRALLLQSVLFSNRNATATEAEIGAELGDLKKIRFDLIRSGRWANDDEKGLLQAEVLVLQAVPGYLIRRNGRLLRNPTEDEAASLSAVE